ncbi:MULTISPECIES: hypothetical protein [Colwellia]|uniref:Uncharacterized protein n=1 Tax=Colwellia marinimaniae TaxID=1513592 RepID=A0ABQ0MVT2_9GAMM|nr:MULTISPECIES: hypothetical protein [Colwellia]GAW96471.1 hypothetical protein MTCD1_02086 [Colwellia marinimaniae]
MTSKNIVVPRISATKRKDPLTDLTSLNRIAKLATKTARIRAFKNRAYITIAQHGKIYKVYSDGKKEIVKDKNVVSIPRIEDDLCLA